MEIKKTDQVKIASLWVLALCLPIFWHPKAQNPFLFSKELFLRFYIVILLAIILWKYNKFFSIFLGYSLGFTFLKLSTRSLWALGNLRDFFLYYLILRIFLESINWKQTLYPYLISLAIILATSFAQLLSFDITRHGTYLYHGEYWKLAGFFGNTHILKTWIGICAPLAFLLPKFWATIPLAIIFGSLIFFGRSYGGLTIAVFSCSITGFILFKRKLNVRIILFSILLMGILGVSYQNKANSVRRQIIHQTIPHILKHPIIGNGLNSFGAAGIIASGTPELQAHNEPLSFIHDYGLPFSIFGIFLLLLNYYLKLKSLEDKLAKGILSGLFYGFIYYSCFSFPFHMAHSATLFLTTIAIIDSIKQKEAQRCGFSGSLKTLHS